MTGCSMLFLVAALVAAPLGFGVAAGVASAVARVAFLTFLFLSLVSAFRGRRP